MKVLKSGNTVDPLKWRHKFTCKKCSANLEGSYSDLSHKQLHDIRGEPSRDMYYFSCPECSWKHSMSDHLPAFRSSIISSTNHKD